ncbi:hypothetical protein [uncultured Roseibium sp.]|uniref:hypothetical protein n=1 Tax=uncultured Roseibium sp. TaxID=1936171 RepID=UPI00260728BA|nr:hypothetical protein [uncultured Roseibium sp.]
MQKSLKPLSCAALVLASLMAGNAVAGDVKIVGAEARASGDSWTFSVTLEHDDTGWDHYADLWQVFTPDGDLLGERVLHHPHVDEQPFTRSLSGVKVPEGINEVVIKARDSVHGVSAQEFRITLKP